MSGSLADALTGAYLNASVGTVNTNVTNLGGSTRLGSTQRLDSGEHFIRIVLTNATTITATRDNNNEGTSTVSYELLEYNA
jgi:hypothetical protein